MTLSLFEVAISPSTLAMAVGIMVLTLCKVLSIRDSRFAAPLKLGTSDYVSSVVAWYRVAALPIKMSSNHVNVEKI